MSERVSGEEDGRRTGGGRRGVDTELKTKTPHVNVGKNFEKSFSNRGGGDAFRV